MKKVIVAIVVLLPWTGFCSCVADDLLLVRFDADGQKVAAKLFDYLDSGWTFWVLGASGASPIVYGGRWQAHGNWFIEGAAGFPIDSSKGKLRVTDIVFDADFFYTKGRVALAFVNEVGGFYGTLSLFGEQEVRIDLPRKWVIGARSNSFQTAGKNSFVIGPFVGRKYGPLRVTLWPWRNALEWSSYGLTIQAKGVVKY